MTLSFYRCEWGFKKKIILSALSDNKGDEWSRFVPLCDVVRAGKSPHSAKDGLTTSPILTKCHLFDLIWGMDFHLRSLERIRQRENDAGVPSSRMGLQEENNTIRPVEQ
ncbi:hypothetical protein CEXT_33061 [Caerostris extrusa]|uniref:Uncharacterized protein n=1 Tax=Caerostris extrusa TaxID=172846 RepID=A0AAV4Q6I1_CAEEX|nr:hypothetical protein CEXT_33061 [Caerostris extrusa]